MGLWRDKTRGDWRYSFRYLRKAYAGGGFRTKGDARSAREDRRKAAKASHISTRESMGLSQAIAQYLAHSEKRFARKTHEYKKFVLDALYQEIGDREIDQVSSGSIERYLDGRPSNHNFNVHRKEIGAFFSYCRKKKWIQFNPASDIERMPETKFVKYIPPKADVLRLLNAAREKERPLLLVLLHTMARIDEILRLTWEDIDFEGSRIRLWTRKTSDGSLVPDNLPMNEELKAVLLDLYKNREQNRWVFYFRKNKNRYNHRPKFMRGLCKRAKIRAFGFHSLRHFGATYLASQGIAGKTLSGLLRHRSLQTTEIYLQSLDGAQKEAVKKLEGVFLLAPDACAKKEKAPDYASGAAD